MIAMRPITACIKLVERTMAPYMPTREPASVVVA